MIVHISLSFSFFFLSFYFFIFLIVFERPTCALRMTKLKVFPLCSIAESFAFLVCTKWSNPMIHRNSHTREASSSSTSIRYLDWNSGLVVSSEDDQDQDRLCGLQDIGGHLMKIPVIGFQVLLCMRLEVCYLKLLLYFLVLSIPSLWESY